jgi:hypothetical protein
MEGQSGSSERGYPSRTDRRIVAPCTVFVDESGTPVTRIPRGAGDRDGYVLAAIAVDPTLEPLFHGMLPRGVSGEILKFSSRDLTAHALANLVAEALSTTPIEVCLVMTSTADEANAAMSLDLIAAINERRDSRHNPHTGEAGVIYAYALGSGVLGVLEQMVTRTGRKATFVDVVLDDASVSKREKGNLAQALRLDMQRCGSECGDIRWTSEELEPMLSVCDLFAGVYRRQAIKGDVDDALQLMEAAERCGRIRIVDGIAPLDSAHIRKGTREGRMIQTLTFGEPETMQDPHREVTVVRYPFTVAPCVEPGSGARTDAQERHSISIEVPNFLAEVVWGLSPDETQKVVFAYAKDHVVRRLAAGTLRQNEELKVDAEGLRPACPYKPGEIEVQIGLAIEVEIPKQRRHIGFSQRDGGR